MSEFEWIANQQRFEELVQTLRSTPAFALDTEFHRERTYVPVLALLQVASAEGVALVDPLAVDVSPLSEDQPGGP